MTIHCLLDELLTERGVTAVQVSQATGIAESTLSELRTGKVRRVGIDVMNKLCAYFQVESLFRWEPEGSGSEGEPQIGEETRH